MKEARFYQPASYFSGTSFGFCMQTSFFTFAGLGLDNVSLRIQSIAVSTSNVKNRLKQ